MTLSHVDRCEEIREFFNRRSFLRNFSSEFAHPVITETEWEILKERKAIPEWVELDLLGEELGAVTDVRWIYLAGFVDGWKRAK